MGTSPKQTVWTAEALSLLGKIPDAELVRQFRIDRNSVFRKRRQLGIDPLPHRFAWTDDEDEKVQRLTVQEAACKTGRTIVAVKERKRKLQVQNEARPFTAREDKWLGKHSDAHVAAILRREVGEIRTRRESLGIERCRKETAVPWKANELKLLGKRSDAELGRLLRRSPLAVARKRREKGIDAIQPQKRWSPEEDEFVRTKSLQEAAEATGRSKEAVQMRRSFLGVSRRTPRWRPWEKAQLGKLPDRVLSIRLRRSVAGVKLKRQSLKIAAAENREPG